MFPTFPNEVSKFISLHVLWQPATHTHTHTYTLEISIDFNDIFAINRKGSYSKLSP